MNSALVVVDIQNDYFPGGRMELSGAVQASERARDLIDAFRMLELPVIFIKHVAERPGATFFLPDTEGVEIYENVRPRSGEPVIVKHFPNSFRDTALLSHLRTDGIERIVLCGMMTHMCIDTTARAAFDHGFDCLIAGDACATRDLQRDGRTVPAAQVQDAFLAALHGTFARVMPGAAIAANELPAKVGV